MCIRDRALEGIGVSATGQINSHTGVVAGTCGNLPNYIGSPIKEQDVYKRQGVPRASWLR